jgi:two-component system sensor histidine kinase UhpB
MSLQFRALSAIAILLVLSLAVGAALLSMHAQKLVALELRTAFNGAVQSVGDTLRSDVEHTVTLREVVASFQGQRHVRAALVNEKGKVIVQSQIAHIAAAPPAWFTRAMAPAPLTARIPIALPQYPCVVVLTSDPTSEIAEVWDHVRDAFAVMLLFCLVTMAVVAMSIAAATRFLRKFQAGLTAIAGGSYDARLDVRGPPEFARLARGFNDMASQLSALSRSNRQLYTQLQNSQEDERAAIARDLHDQVGPYLFAIQVDAKAVGKAGTPDALRLSQSIRETVGHIQQHVKAILRQLRPVTQLAFGLESAIGDIAAFWRRRHPHIRFTLDIRPLPALDRRTEETAYRIVQEGVSNAVRHGKPSRIAITVHAGAGQLIVQVEDDGRGVTAQAEEAVSLGGAGIAGMRERIAELSGRFEIGDAGPRGVRMRASLPLSPQRKQQEHEPA